MFNLKIVLTPYVRLFPHGSTHVTPHHHGTRGTFMVQIACSFKPQCGTQKETVKLE